MNYDGDEGDYEDADDNDGDDGLNTNNYEDNPNFSSSHNNADDFANFIEVKRDGEDNDAKEDSENDFDGFRFRRQISVCHILFILFMFFSYSFISSSK